MKKTCTDEEDHCDHWYEGDGPCCMCRQSEWVDNEGKCRHVEIEDGICIKCGERQ